MQKYAKLGFAIEVSLHHTGYVARANILKDSGGQMNAYDITLELRRKDIPRWDMMDEEHFIIESDNINMDTYNFIMDKFKDGFFDRHIKRYEYELKCFDRGVEDLGED